MNAGGARGVRNCTRRFTGGTQDSAEGIAGETCAAGEVCSEGARQLSCQTDLMRCCGTRVDPNSNPRCCGATNDCAEGTAGETCAAGEVCSNGASSVSRRPGLECRSRSCLDPYTNPLFCGPTNDFARRPSRATCTACQVCPAGRCPAPRPFRPNGRGSLRGPQAQAQRPPHCELLARSGRVDLGQP